MFDAQGYTIRKGFLEPETVAGAREAIAALVEGWAASVGQAGAFADAPLEMRLIRLHEATGKAPALFRPELHLPGLFPVFFHPRLLDLVETMLGPEIRLYPNYSARPKLPEHAPTEVLWHQDGGYTASGGADAAAVGTLRMVNVWTPLVPARIETGCMEFIPGTHRLGPVPHETRTHYLEIAPDRLAPVADQAVAIELDPGDIVLFHNLLFHRGLPNRSKIVRWSLDWRYQDATQPTLRRESGQTARSRAHPERVVRSAAQWTRLPFG